MNEDIRPQRASKPAPAVIKKDPPKPAEPITEPAKPAVKPELSRAGRIKHKLWFFKRLTKKQMLIVIAGLIVLGAGGAYGLHKLTRVGINEADSISVAPEPPKPTTVASRMTGVQVAPELNELPVTGVMIENSPDARPQSGLLQADMVFEAIAEGGITRFLALYQESQPDYIGPVRSARPYYLDFLVQYDAALAHAGGSSEALAQIRNQGIKDIDHGPNGDAFQRVNNRYAPHNLYTSRAKLLAVHNRRGYTGSSYKGLARREAEEPVSPATARVIDFAISSFLYNPRFEYDAASNTYKRSLAGKPHVDERSGTQIAPKVVVALVMPHRYAGIYSVYQTTGSNDAFIFQNGTVTAAKWHKSSRKAELTLTDAAGTAIALNPGQTWFTLVANTAAVKHAP